MLHCTGAAGAFAERSLPEVLPLVRAYTMFLQMGHEGWCSDYTIEAALKTTRHWFVP